MATLPICFPFQPHFSMSHAAGILATKIMSISNEFIHQKLEEYQKSLTDKVLKSVDDMKGEYPNFYDLEL